MILAANGVAENSRGAITLASRDSLLALSQTIDAALKLKTAGFRPKIICLKTAGDLKLDAPLYSVAAENPSKEGRAFFTRELDHALIENTADAAVHSFKDLPTEKIAGISDPVFFSETTGADILVSLQPRNLARDADQLVIGTSSLRRIHQLTLAYPATRTAMLRGNIVTRLKKLIDGDRGMNAILIAGAGLGRLLQFARLDPAVYADFLDSAAAAHIAGELKKFEACMKAGILTQTLDEESFPTAPGQGVLALQMSARFAAAAGTDIHALFGEHEKISRRVMLERSVMAELGTGCHAPLGVSVLTGPAETFRISTCFSRHVEIDPVRFADSVFLKRIIAQDAKAVVREIQTPFTAAFWWGFKDAPAASGMRIVPVLAIRQSPLEVSLPATEKFTVVFAASPAVIPWLARNPVLTDAKIFAAGEETAIKLREQFPSARIITAAHRGFAAAWAEMRQNPGDKILWLGSRSGSIRAKQTTNTSERINFLSVYENTALSPAELLANHPELSLGIQLQTSIHMITSAAAAEAFVEFSRSSAVKNPAISCFGESAAEYLFAQGFTPYHISRAETFTDYLAEVRGETATMRQKGNHGN